MNNEKGGINYQDKSHHEGPQNNTVKTDNNTTSHREMNQEQGQKRATESDTANQADTGEDQPR